MTYLVELAEDWATRLLKTGRESVRLPTGELHLHGLPATGPDWRTEPFVRNLTDDLIGHIVADAIVPYTDRWMESQLVLSGEVKRDKYHNAVRCLCKGVTDLTETA